MARPPSLALKPMTPVDVLARLLVLRLPLMCLARVEVLPPVHQRAPLIVGVPVLTTILRHLLVRGLVPPAPIHVHDDGGRPKTMHRRVLLLLLVVPRRLVPLNPLERPNLHRVGVGVTLALALPPWMALLRGAPPTIAQVCLVTLVTVVLVIVMLLVLTPLPRRLERLEQPPVDRIPRRRCRVALLVLLV